MHRFFTGLGKFTVKYRWIILAVWLVGTFAAVKALPSLSSQVNNDNSAFLPASAPDVKAANLAAPLVGKESLAPIIVIADRTNGQLTAADVTAVEREVNLLKGVTNVKQVLFLGTSPNGRAVQIEALANIGGFGIQPAENTVNGAFATFPKAGAPPGSPIPRGRPDRRRRSAERRIEELGQSGPGLLAPVHHHLALLDIPLGSRSFRDAPAGGHRASAVGFVHRSTGFTRPEDLRHHPAIAHRHRPRSRYRLRVVPSVPRERRPSFGDGTERRGRPRGVARR